MATFPVFWYSSRRSAAKSRAYNGPRSTVYCPCTRFQAYPRIGEGVGARTEMERSRIKRDTALNHPPAEWKLTFNPRTRFRAYANHLSSPPLPSLPFSISLLSPHFFVSRLYIHISFSFFPDASFISDQPRDIFDSIESYSFLRSKFGLERMDILYKICKIRTCKESFWESIISARE